MLPRAAATAAAAAARRALCAAAPRTAPAAGGVGRGRRWVATEAAQEEGKKPQGAPPEDEPHHKRQLRKASELPPLPNLEPAAQRPEFHDDKYQVNKWDDKADTLARERRMEALLEHREEKKKIEEELQRRRAPVEPGAEPGAGDKDDFVKSESAAAGAAGSPGFNKDTHWVSEADKKSLLKPTMREAHPLSWCLELSMTDLARAIREGKVTAVEVVQVSLTELQTRSADLHLVTSLSMKALAEAQALDAFQKERGKCVGPLHGVPFLVKDDIHVAGLPTTMGTKALADFVPGVSAPAVQALVAAGAVVVGKANMHELGMGLIGHNSATGGTPNPFDAKFYSGGSSGGSAVAVAVECVPFSLATDMSGDIRVPSSYCGCVGFVPTPKRYSRKRVWMLSKGKGGVGVIARTVRDVQLLDSILTASVEEDDGAISLAACRPTPPPVQAPEVPELLVPEDFFNLLLTPQIFAVFNLTVELLRSQDIKIHECVRETHYAQSLDQRIRDEAYKKKSTYDSPTHSPGWNPENMALVPLGMSWYRTLTWERYESYVRLKGICKQAGISVHELTEGVLGRDVKNNLASIQSGLPEAAVQDGKNAVEIIRGCFEIYWEEISEETHALLFPTCILPPTAAAEAKQDAPVMMRWNDVDVAPEMMQGRNTDPITLAGLPSVTIPMCKNLSPEMDGCASPVGMMLVGRPGDDARLLAVAAEVDRRLRPASRQLKQIAEHRRNWRSPMQDEEPVLPDAPVWMEDRTKNMQAGIDDYVQARWNEGAHHGLYRQGLRLTSSEERHVHPARIMAGDTPPWMKKYQDKAATRTGAPWDVTGWEEMTEQENLDTTAILYQNRDIRLKRNEEQQAAAGPQAGRLWLEQIQRGKRLQGGSGSSEFGSAQQGAPKPMSKDVLQEREQVEKLLRQFGDASRSS